MVEYLHSVHLGTTHGCILRLWLITFCTPGHNTWLYTKVMVDYILYTCTQHVAVYNGVDEFILYTCIHNTWLYCIQFGMDEFILYTCTKHVAVYNGMDEFILYACPQYVAVY